MTARWRLSKRTRDAITLYGALIVFATFTVREGIRDFIGGKINEIELTETAYYTYIGTLTTFDMLWDLSRRVDAIRDTMPVASDGFGRLGRPAIEAPRYTSELVVTRALMFLNYLRELVRRLPRHEKAAIDEFDGFQQRADALKSTEDALVKLLDTRSLDEAAGRKALNDLSKQVQDGMKLNLDLTAFSDRLFQAFRRSKADAQHIYDVSSWISYALFVVGWGLALYGRLYGAGETSSGD